MTEEAYDELPDGFSRDQISDALLEAGLERVVASLQAGLLDLGEDGSPLEVIFFRHDASEIRQRATTKACDYRVAEGRDLLCAAADATDPTFLVLSGTRGLAPTSHPLCRDCGLPSSEMLCSYLSRPGVVGINTAEEGLIGRRVIAALCNAGRPEIDDPTKCRPEQNPCWRLKVDPLPDDGSETAHSFLALLDELDFLNSAWRVTFGNDLLKVGSMTGVANLGSPASSRASFSERLTDLADLVKRFQIPGDLVDREGNPIAADHTLSRMEAVIRDHADTDDADVATVGQAVKRLRTVNDARAGFQHGSTTKISKALSELGLPPPVVNWAQAWERVSGEAASAVAEIRSVVRRLR